MHKNNSKTKNPEIVIINVSTDRIMTLKKIDIVIMK